jgi:hypothetical protein
MDKQIIMCLTATDQTSKDHACVCRPRTIDKPLSSEVIDDIPTAPCACLNPCQSRAYFDGK